MNKLVRVMVLGLLRRVRHLTRYVTQCDMVTIMRLVVSWQNLVGTWVDLSLISFFPQLQPRSGLQEQPISLYPTFLSHRLIAKPSQLTVPTHSPSLLPSVPVGDPWTHDCKTERKRAREQVNNKNSVIMSVKRSLFPKFQQRVAPYMFPH